MTPLKQTFQVELTTLTPLHIGTGDRLREGYDFIALSKHLWVANQGALMRALLIEAEAEKGGAEEAARVAGAIAGMTLYELKEAGRLRKEHFAPERGLFHYHLPGKTSTTQKQGELHEQIKDVYGRPYLPGSSIKGALRSVLMRKLAREDTRKPEINYKPTKHGFDSRFAAQIMEKRHFMPTREARAQFPNYDLWRAFQVFDTTAVPAQGSLMLGNVQVFPVPEQDRRGGDLSFDMEMLTPETRFEATWQVDNWLFTSPEAEKLGFSANHLARFTTQLCQIVNADTTARLAEEEAFLKSLLGKYEVKTALQILGVLKQYQAALAENELMIQVGKSTGWLSKTLGHVLLERLSKTDFEQFVSDFDMGRQLWHYRGRIPLTRQLAGGIAYLGWLKIRLNNG